jgi:hypothetical protein
MAEFTPAADALNATETAWLDAVHSTLSTRPKAGSRVALAELGTACPRSKGVKGKCRKVSAMLEADARFRLVEGGDKVELTSDSTSTTTSTASNTTTTPTTATALGSTPHASFLLYMSAMREEEVVVSEQQEHLQRHYTVWKKSTAGGKQHAGIEEIHLTEVIASLQSASKLHVHPATDRLVLETYAGRIEARTAALNRSSNSASASAIAAEEDIESSPPVHTDDIPGAYTNITGTNYKNVKFLDFNEFELSMFGDTGEDHGYEVRGATYKDDNTKLNTGIYTVIYINIYI